MIEYIRTNPFRIPQWRWVRAENVTSGGPPATARRDGGAGAKWIRMAARFQHAFARCGTDEYLKMELAYDYPDMFWAHHIWTQNNNPAKWAIEARIMARETDADIAGRMGCSKEMVAIYESLFFNVREKLDYKDYVVNCVLAESVIRGLNERDHDTLWKLLGYMCGPSVLDIMIHKLVNPTWVSKAEDVPAVCQDMAINLMKKKAMLSSLIVPINNQTCMQIIEAFVKYVEVERSTDSASQAQSVILQGIQGLLSGLPFGVGNREQSASQQQLLLEYDSNHAELRNDELMIAAAGVGLPSRHLLQTLRFPEAPNATINQSH